MPESQIIRVLLVEDNPGDVFLFKATLARLRERSFNVVQFDRVSEALAWLNEETPDVIVTDLNLPDSVGVDTVRQLLRHSGFIPVIALTGWEDRTLGAQLIEEGVAAFWSKERLAGTDLALAIIKAIERPPARR